MKSNLNEKTTDKIMEAFEEITKFKSKFGTQQGTRANDINKTWTNSEARDLFWEGGETEEDTQFILTDITTSQLIFARMLDTWKKFNRTVFGEQWIGEDATKAFKDSIEKHLFNGRVAVFKEETTKEILAANFSDMNEGTMNLKTGLPNEIQIISDYSLIKDVKLNTKKVAIGYNTSTRMAELAYDLPSIELIINSYMALSMAIKKAKPKTFIAGMEDNTIAEEIHRAIQSDRLIEFLNVPGKMLAQFDIRFETHFKEKMEMVMSSLADFFKWKGFNGNGLILKKERQSEDEIQNNDEFKHYLIWNKIEERRELAKQLQEKLGMKIEYDGEELLNELKDKKEEEGENKDEKQD